MTNPIKIDISKLTMKHFEEATKNSAGSRGLYSSPCILGTLMTPEERDYLKTNGFDSCGIRILIANGIVEVSSDQEDDIFPLQKLFDNNSIDLLREKILEIEGSNV
jgi:hypothetical protein